MKFIVTRDYEELSQAMAQLMLKHMYTEKECTNIAITTGSTCIQGYRLLAKQACGRPWFGSVHYYIFDGFRIRDEHHEKEIPICQISLDEKYFHAAEVAPDHIHDLNMENCKTFDKDTQKQGGLDLVIMGIGKNDHFCGNQPGTFDSWSARTRFVRADKTPYLREHSRKLLHRDFRSEDTSRIPEHYITIGPKTIMSTKDIIFPPSGKEKTETAKKAFMDPVAIEFPVSIFQLHPHAIVIFDEVAAALLPL